MPESVMSETAFRAAQTRFEDDLFALLRRHRAALGGELGVIHALIEIVGRLGAGTLEVLGSSPQADQARRHLSAQITQLALFVAAAGTPPQ